MKSFLSVCIYTYNKVRMKTKNGSIFTQVENCMSTYNPHAYVIVYRYVFTSLSGRTLKGTVQINVYVGEDHFVYSVKFKQLFV